jgi:preprotein translocase subunit YajC
MGGEWITLAVVMALALAGYWSLVIFPKQREFSKRQRFARTLVEGDEVITAGGIIGRVLEIRGLEGIALVEIAPGVIVRAVTASLLQPFDPEELAHNAQLGLREEDAAAPRGRASEDR